MEGVHIKRMVCRIQQRFQIINVTLQSKVNLILKTCLWLLMRTPVFFDQGITYYRSFNRGYALGVKGQGQVCLKKKVDIIRKYHNHTIQTNQRHCEEAPQNTNSHKTSRTQLKKGNLLPLPHQGDYNTKRTQSNESSPTEPPH